MKKFGSFFLILFVFAMVSSTKSYAGSFVIDDNPSPTVTFQVGEASTEAYIPVSNISGQMRKVRVRMINEVVAPGHQTSFCWGDFCYSPSILVSPQAFSFAAGTKEKIKGALNTGGVGGTTKVTYEVFDELNPEDKVSFQVTFTSETSTDFHEISDLYSAPTLSLASPSPAGETVRIEYNTGAQANSNLVLTLYNLIGNPVKSIGLSNPAGTITVETADLNSGMYFYSIISNGRKLATKKLIVKH